MSASKTTRRAVLYGTALCLAGALGYAGFVWKPAADVDTRLEPVFMAARTKDYAGARAALAAVESDFPDVPKLALTRAFLDECEGRLDDALAIYLKVADRFEGVDQKRDVLLSAADLERRMKRPAACEEILRGAVARFGESWRSKQLQILLLIDGGRTSDALSLATRAAEEDPANPQAQRLRRELLKAGEH